MTDAVQEIQEIGFAGEPTEGVSAITDANKPKHFGLYETTWGKFPSYVQNVQSYYRGGTLDPYRKKIYKTSIAGQVSYIPVDGLMWRYGLSGASAIDANTHGITPIQAGELPSFSMRYESSNGTNYHRHDAVGNKVKRMSTSIDFGLEDNFMVNNLVYIGRKLIKTTSLTDNQRISPIYANNDVKDNQKPYRVDNNFAWKWDVDGENVELKSEGVDFIYILDTMNRPRWFDGQKYVQMITTGNRVHAVSFRLKRRGVTELFDDYVDQPEVETFKDMSFKIYQDSNKYIKYYFGDVTMSKCDMNKSMEDEPYYDIETLPESVSIEIYDGVSTTLYGY